MWEVRLIIFLGCVTLAFVVGFVLMFVIDYFSRS